jgi:YD repeat-containing protein
MIVRLAASSRFRVLLVALLAWMLVAVTPALAAPTSMDRPVATYAYDSPHLTATDAGAQRDRGPPSHPDLHHHQADNRGLIGVSARTDETSTSTTYTYDASARFVSVAHKDGPQGVVTATATQGQVRATDGANSTPSLSVVAAKTAPINGETVATALGRATHKSWDYGPGFSKEFTLKAGGRVDALNMQTRHVIELKPNNPRAIRLGERQLDGYIEKLNAQFPGEPWTGSVVTYP